MAENSHLDTQINNLLERLNTKQKKAVLTVVKTFAEEQNSFWDDDAYAKEMGKRFKELEGGKVKALSLDELETAARNAYVHKKSGK